MKNTLIATLFVVILLAAGCQQEASVQEVMDSEEQRKEVFAIIMDNPDMRQEMMQTMRQHPEGGMMMRGEGMMGRRGMMGDTTIMMGDTARMGGMSREDMRSMMQQMIAACAEDSANCNQMAQMMTQHRQAMEGMMRQMRQKGMMDENCYQQMMKNMSNTAK